MSTIILKFNQTFAMTKIFWPTQSIEREYTYMYNSRDHCHKFLPLNPVAEIDSNKQKIGTFL